MKKKLTLISGPCAIEERETAFFIAREVSSICEELGIHYIFKASYKKANRTRSDSFSGIGDKKALEIIQEIGKTFNLETITDVHESKDPPIVAKYVTHLQIPAFLCRQTDLLIAAGKTGLGINIKKGQFLSPEAMKFPMEKVLETGNQNVWLCERGVTFGYNDLVVDSTSVARMKKLGAKVIMDCTHSTQKPNRTVGVTGGDPELIETIALSAVATGADGLFIETHPQPSIAKSDAAAMLELSRLRPLLEKVLKVWKAVN